MDDAAGRLSLGPLMGVVPGVIAGGAVQLAAGAERRLPDRVLTFRLRPDRAALFDAVRGASAQER